MQIAAASFDDAEVVQMIARLTAEMARRYPNEGGAGKPSTAAEFAPPHGMFLVARVDGLAMGCVGLKLLSERPRKIGELKRMFVDPAARGRGVGKALLAALEARARALGYEAIWLEAGTPQPEALGLYEAVGYKVIAPFGEFKASPLTVAFGKELSAGT